MSMKHFGGMRIGRGNWYTLRKPAPVPLCPPQIPYDLTSDRNRAAAVGSRWLTACAMVRPYFRRSSCNIGTVDKTDECTSRSSVPVWSWAGQQISSVITPRALSVTYSLGVCRVTGYKHVLWLQLPGTASNGYDSVKLCYGAGHKFENHQIIRNQTNLLRRFKAVFDHSFLRVFLRKKVTQCSGQYLNLEHRVCGQVASGLDTATFAWLDYRLIDEKYKDIMNL
jgi:hypothetical protein